MTDAIIYIICPPISCACRQRITIYINDTLKRKWLESTIRNLIRNLMYNIYSLRYEESINRGQRLITFAWNNVELSFYYLIFPHSIEYEIKWGISKYRVDFYEILNRNNLRLVLTSMVGFLVSNSENSAIASRISNLIGFQSYAT